MCLKAQVWQLKRVEQHKQLQILLSGSLSNVNRVNNPNNKKSIEFGDHKKKQRAIRTTNEEIENYRTLT